MLNNIILLILSGLSGVNDKKWSSIKLGNNESRNKLYFLTKLSLSLIKGRTLAACTMLIAPDASQRKFVSWTELHELPDAACHLRCISVPLLCFEICVFACFSAIPPWMFPADDKTAMPFIHVTAESAAMYFATSSLWRCWYHSSHEFVNTMSALDFLAVPRATSYLLFC